MPLAVAQVRGERDLGERLLLELGDHVGVLGGAPALQPLEHLALAAGLDEAPAAVGDLLLGRGQLLAGLLALALGAGDECLAGLQLMPRHGRAVRRGARQKRRLRAAGGLVEGLLPAGLEGQLGGQLLLGLMLDLLAESADGLEIEGERLLHRIRFRSGIAPDSSWGPGSAGAPHG